MRCFDEGQKSRRLMAQGTTAEWIGPVVSNRCRSAEHVELQVAKHQPGPEQMSDRFVAMRQRKYPEDSRLYNGIRRIDVSLPVDVVVALDQDIKDFGYFVSRSSVIEVAIRQFLERGGIAGSGTGASGS